MRNLSHIVFKNWGHSDFAGSVILGLGAIALLHCVSESETSSEDDPSVEATCTTCGDTGDTGSGGGTTITTSTSTTTTTSSSTLEPGVDCVDIEYMSNMDYLKLSSSEKQAYENELNAAIQEYASNQLTALGIKQGDSWNCTKKKSKYTCTGDSSHQCEDWECYVNPEKVFNSAAATAGAEPKYNTKSTVTYSSTSGEDCDAINSCTGESTSEDPECSNQDVKITTSVHSLTTAPKVATTVPSTSTPKMTLSLLFYDSINSNTLTVDGTNDSARYNVINTCDDDSYDAGSWGSNVDTVSMWDIDWESDDGSTYPSVKYPEIMGMAQYSIDGAFYIDLGGTKSIDGTKYWTFDLTTQSNVTDLEEFTGATVHNCDGIAMEGEPIDLPQFYPALSDPDCPVGNINNEKATCGFDDDMRTLLVGNDKEEGFCTDTLAATWGTLATEIKTGLETPQKDTNEDGTVNSSDDTAYESMDKALRGVLSGALTVTGVNEVALPKAGYSPTLSWTSVSVNSSKQYVFKITKKFE